jgi:hypothetical protein
MRTNFFFIYLSSCLGVTAGCDLFGPAPSLSHAAAVWGCGPADGPTVAILLAPDPIRSFPPSIPYVNATIWNPPYPLAGHTWSVSPRGEASASFVPWPGALQSASSGSITITSVDSSRTVDGVVDLQFPSRMVTTHFKAPWISSGVYCN